MIQNEAAAMETKERLAKVQARARAYTNIAHDHFHENEGYQQQTFQQQKDKKQFHIEEEVDFRNRISQKTESVIYHHVRVPGISLLRIIMYGSPNKY